ncbi:MAG TPA: hypothetical protein VG498_15735, partial [Terriglobales bacterium]|nr:hypothetical protein [Terriglobales bacterium]
MESLAIMGRSQLLLLIFNFLSLFLSAQSVTNNQPSPKFSEVAKQAGLTASHIASVQQHYIIEAMSGGVGFIDCDNDG